MCGAILGIEQKLQPMRLRPSNSLIINKAKEIYQDRDLLKITNDPNYAAEGANVLYTDVWSSMGEENQKRKRKIEILKVLLLIANLWLQIKIQLSCIVFLRIDLKR